MKVDVKNFSLQEILKEISDGEIQLPEFQRDYVWNRTDKKALLESIFNGYPIGSLLLQEMDEKKPMFAWVALNSIDISNSKKIFEKGKKKTPPKYLVLDGQQRLTTLGQIVLNCYDIRSYFLRTHLLFEKWIDNGAITDELALKNWLDNEISFADIIGDTKHKESPLSLFKNKNRWVSLTVLESQTRFDTEKNNELVDVMDKIHILKNRLTANKTKYSQERMDKVNAEIDELKNWKSFFTHVFHHIFHNFFNFTIPCVIVPKEMSIQGVCKIFTTTNTRGVKLGAFDLCIATLYPKDIQLKQLFEKAMADYPLISALDKHEKRYVLQYLALANGRNPKTAGLPKVIEKDFFGQENKFWEDRLDELNYAITQLDTYCGSGLASGDSKCLAYSPLVPPLAFVLKRFPISEELKGPEEQLRIQKLRSWYFSAAISTRYGEGSDNKQERDINEKLTNDTSMVDWFRSDTFEDDMPKWIKGPKYQELDTSGSGAVGKAMLSILSKFEAKDFWDENYTVGHANKDDIHHIFPKAALRRIIEKEENVNSARALEIIKKKYKVDSKLNLTFLKASTNRTDISDKDPKDYFSQLLKSKNSLAEENRFKENLKLHLINDDCLSALLKNDYTKFIEARKKLFKNEFAIMGVQNFSDSDSEEEVE